MSSGLFAWLCNPCRFGHKWVDHSGSVVCITAAERHAYTDSVLFKDSRYGWLRYERVCRRCIHRQYLRELSTLEPSAVWENIVEP